jgi:hypothetical protein
VQAQTAEHPNIGSHLFPIREDEGKTTQGAVIFYEKKFQKKR